MQLLNKSEFAAVLELLKQHAQAVSKQEYIKTLEAMQKKLDGKSKTKEKVSGNPEP